MGRINIPPSSRVTGTEDLYYKIQIIPDRIAYTIPGTAHNILQGVILGPASYNSKVQENFESLQKYDRLDMNGVLYRVWLAYHGAVGVSQNLGNDKAMNALLLEFQSSACTGSSYAKLPETAAKAAFWERAAEVPLPRITLQEHQAMHW